VKVQQLIWSGILVSFAVSSPVLAQQAKPPNVTPRGAAQNICTVEGKSFPSYSACTEHFAVIAEKNGTGRAHDHHSRDCALAGCK
jgi:hypothetical protein